MLREDAASEAVNEAVDKFITEGCYDEELARRTIESSLRQASRKRQLEPMSKESVGIELQGNNGVDHFHGYEVK